MKHDDKCETKKLILDAAWRTAQGLNYYASTNS